MLSELSDNIIYLICRSDILTLLAGQTRFTQPSTPGDWQESRQQAQHSQEVASFLSSLLDIVLHTTLHWSHIPLDCNHQTNVRTATDPGFSGGGGDEWKKVGTFPTLRGGVWGGGVPSSLLGGVWVWVWLSPPQKIFAFFTSKSRILSHTYCVILKYFIQFMMTRIIPDKPGSKKILMINLIFYFKLFMFQEFETLVTYSLLLSYTTFYFWKYCSDYSMCYVVFLYVVCIKIMEIFKMLGYKYYYLCWKIL